MGMTKMRVCDAVTAEKGDIDREEIPPRSGAR
jgi:hypothetical protein